MIYLLVIPILVLASIIWLSWNEPRFLYHPSRSIDETPDRAGLHYENINLTTSDGVNINGWFVPGEDLSEAGHGVKLTVLFFHGNAGNISHRLEKLAIFRELGVDTFIIDYRGYGRSEGQPNEEGTYHDAQTAYEYLTQQRKVAPHSIIAYGESLGCAIATDLASKVPVGGLVLEEGFASTAAVGQEMFPFLPVRWLVRNKYDTIAKLPGIHIPLLVLHSREDTLINFSHGQRLFAAANEPKQFVELRGGHNDAFEVSALTYRAALSKFFVACES
jgi:pimeloyl-ACP methyl ester carboxylesterase